MKQYFEKWTKCVVNTLSTRVEATTGSGIGHQINARQKKLRQWIHFVILCYKVSTWHEKTYWSIAALLNTD